MRKAAIEYIAEMGYKYPGKPPLRALLLMPVCNFVMIFVAKQLRLLVLTTKDKFIFRGYLREIGGLCLSEPGLSGFSRISGGIEITERGVE